MLEQIEKEWSVYWFNFVTSLPKPNYSCIATNQNLSDEIIVLTMENINWSEKMYMANQSISLDILIDLGVQWYQLVCHKKMNINFILKYYSTRLYDLYSWGLISGLKIITLEIVKNNITLPWDWIGLSYNKSIKLNEIAETKDLYPWEWHKVSARKDLTYEFVKNHPEIPFCKNTLNVNIHYKYSCSNNYTNNVERYVYFRRLSMKDDLSLEYIEENINEMWDWTELTRNKNLTEWFIDKYIDKNWDMDYLSMCVPPEIVKKYPDRGWNYTYLQVNPLMPIDYIPESKLNWELASLNPTITFEYIINNPNKQWCYMSLCQNKFIVEKENFIRRRLQEKFQKSELKEELMKRMHKPDPENPDKWFQRQLELGFIDEELP
jgi:hypothetical protein